MCGITGHGSRSPALSKRENPRVCLLSAIAGKVTLSLDPVKEAVAKELQQRLPFLRRKHFLKDLAFHQCIVEITVCTRSAVTAHQCPVPEFEACREGVPKQVGLQVRERQIEKVVPEILVRHLLPIRLSQLDQHLVTVVELFLPDRSPGFKELLRAHQPFDQARFSSNRPESIVAAVRLHTELPFLRQFTGTRSTGKRITHA